MQPDTANPHSLRADLDIAADLNEAADMLDTFHAHNADALAARLRTAAAAADFSRFLERFTARGEIADAVQLLADIDEGEHTDRDRLRALAALMRL